MLLLFPSPALTTPTHPFLFKQNLCSSSRTMVKHKKCRIQDKFQACAFATSKPTSQNEFCRRDLLLFGLSSSFSIIFPSLGSLAEEELKMASVLDEINSYSYLYPVELPSKKFLFKCSLVLLVVLKWVVVVIAAVRVESRKPERYSSAAPLSPDARLRIVSERVDIIDNLILSVSIGPPNSQFLKTKDKKTWTAKDVADSVLSDKSALRVTSSQRMAESSVLDAHSSEIDGEPYWYYEYLVRKSPTKTAQESNLYRHYVASTAERDASLLSPLSPLGSCYSRLCRILVVSTSRAHLSPFFIPPPSMPPQICGSPEGSATARSQRPHPSIESLHLQRGRSTDTDLASSLPLELKGQLLLF
uniref:PsbP C-terminal domain-containing protein n=1 Tax=Fagus sylvatica TaxID=28930 RepID=A0A2N9FCR8_FAGSY